MNSYQINNIYTDLVEIAHKAMNALERVHNSII